MRPKFTLVLQARFIFSQFETDISSYDTKTLYLCSNESCIHAQGPVLIEYESEHVYEYSRMVGISSGMSHVKWDSGTVKIMGLISTFDQLGLN